jgi:hypothetical protein
MIGGHEGDTLVLPLPEYAPQEWRAPSEVVYLPKISCSV